MSEHADNNRDGLFAATVGLLVIGLFIWPNIKANTYVNTYKEITYANMDPDSMANMAGEEAEQDPENDYKDTLAQTSTPILYNIPNRTDNIILTCKMINETILMPGAIFSFNQAVGIRTEARGFKPAPTFLRGQVVDSVGGGICQVSSTLYNACLLSNLEIVARTNHSMFADYVEKPGFDATVSWDAIDYKFKNNTNCPIKIFAWVEGEIIYVKIMGTKMNDYTVVMESRILSTTPYQTIYKENPDLAPGQTVVVQDPHTGYVVETYRVIKDASGNVINQTLEAKSLYNKTDEIIECNPQSIPADPPLVSSSPTPEPLNPQS